MAVGVEGSQTLRPRIHGGGKKRDGDGYGVESRDLSRLQHQARPQESRPRCDTTERYHLTPKLRSFHQISNAGAGEQSQNNDASR